MTAGEGYGGSGIGTGSSYYGSSRIETLRIENTNVTGSGTASGDRAYGGSGIGTGASYTSGDSSIGTLEIENADVSGDSTSGATGPGATGVASGAAYWGSSRIASMTIKGGNVTGSTATGTGGYAGSGIGTGVAFYAGHSRIERLAIENARVIGSTGNANFGGSGIGTGAADQADSGMAELTIENSIVIGTTGTSGVGGSGIGTGATANSGNSAIGVLAFSGTLTIVCDSLTGQILVSGASISAFTQSGSLFPTTTQVQGSLDLTIVYGMAASSAQEPSLAGLRSLSIGNFTLPAEGRWRFAVSGQGYSPYFSGTIRGLFALIPDWGSYTILADGPFQAFLGPSTDTNSFEVSANDSFLPVAYLHSQTPKPTPEAK
jgi:hypothetical protein